MHTLRVYAHLKQMSIYLCQRAETCLKRRSELIFHPLLYIMYVVTNDVRTHLETNCFTKQNKRQHKPMINLIQHLYY